MKIFIVIVDENRGETITAEELKEKVNDGLYDSEVTVKEL